MLPGTLRPAGAQPCCAPPPTSRTGLRLICLPSLSSVTEPCGGGEGIKSQAGRPLPRTWYFITRLPSCLRPSIGPGPGDLRSIGSLLFTGFCPGRLGRGAHTAHSLPWAVPKAERTSHQQPWGGPAGPGSWGHSAESQGSWAWPSVALGEVSGPPCPLQKGSVGCSLWSCGGCRWITGKESPGPRSRSSLQAQDSQDAG